MAQTKPTAEAIKVKVEATELDKRLMLDKLNEHGRGRGLQFQLADQDFEYRIVFATGQGKTQTLVWGSGGSMNTSEAVASVYNSKGDELFTFKRAGRATDKGAANAAAKEIIKRLLQLRSSK